MVDFGKGFGRHVGARLKRDQVIWLTTVDRRKWPQPRPVWYHWDGSTILIFSQQKAAKLRHIRRSAMVALNLNSDPEGGEVTVILGEARILRRMPDKARLEQYLRKYSKGISSLGYSRAAFLDEYSTPILVRPAAIRGF